MTADDLQQKIQALAGCQRVMVLRVADIGILEALEYPNRPVHGCYLAR
ncbi:MAG: hypothetical protein QOD06_2902 [Candidatus Binatota bacterium]|nr:hypothetical protein [Candidatus Binatota bacterium]